ncbi:MAG TPA: hypothetical protein DCW68_06970 [Rhodospirillaceae bacterium]|nr:hypothetical protein [Rhodospirillaceae bacterium]
MNIQAITVFSEYVRKESDNKITIIGFLGNDTGISQKKGEAIVAPPIMATTFIRFPANEMLKNFKMMAVDGDKEIASVKAEIEHIPTDIPFRSLSISMQIPSINTSQNKRIVILLSVLDLGETIETGSVNLFFKD